MLMDALGFAVDFHRDDSVLHFLEVRRVLEPAAAAVAAVMMPSEDVEGLAALLDELPRHPDIEELVANDIEFHKRIAAATNNPLWCSLLETLSGRTLGASREGLEQ